MSRSTRLIASLLFGSGLSALVYQTAWQRMLRLVFGASTAATAAVLAIFLGGLGLGAAYFGKRIEKSERPLSYYGNLEAGVALAAALTPGSAWLAARIYFGLGGSVALGAWGAGAVRLVLSTMVLGPAVVLMGGTLPAAARAVETQDDFARSRLATLYAANTAGAVAGTLLSTFVLFEVYGTRLSLWSAALLNLLVALLARRFGRVAAPVPVSEPESADDSFEAGVAFESRKVPAALVYAVAAGSGFAFLSLELVWYRMLAPILGGTSFTFGLILAVALAGIGLGGWFYALRDRGRFATPSLLAITLALEALAIGIPLALGDKIAIYAAYTRPMAALGFWALVLSWTFSTAVVVLPAATVAGYQFPVMFALLGEGRRGVSQQVGFAYGFNTAGSIVGALASGFILIPKVGALTSWRLMSGVFVLMALWLTVVICRRRGIRALLEMRASLAACVLGVLCLLSRGPTAATRHSPIGAGRTHLAGKDGNQLEYWRRTAALHVVWEKDGVESTVGIETSHGVSFLVNGKSDGSVFLDRGTQGMSTMLPALLHQNPKSVFVLGLGTGMSAGWVAAIPGVERVDVAELEPAVLEVARRAAAANQGVLKRPNVHLFVGDGREFLLTTNRHYDVISSEPSNPYRAGIASLFTREFYQAVSRHLKAGGLFSQWLQTYEVDVLTLRIALSTIISVFPVVELWQTQSGDLLLLCSREPRVYDIASLRKRAAQEPFRSALRRTWFAEDAEGVLGRFLARDKLTRALAQTFEMPLNTDDNTVLEYAFARHVGSHGGDTTADILDLSVQAGTQRPAVRGEVDWKRVAEARARSWMVSRDEMPRLPELDRDAQARVDVVAAACSGSKAPSFRSLQQQAQTARDVLEWYAMGEGFAHLGDAQALVLADKLATQSHRVEAELIRGRYHAANHRPAEAFDALLRGVGELRRDALPLCSAALQTLELMRNVAKGNPALERRAIQALLSGHFAADLEDELRVRTAQELAFSLGDPEVCVRALGRQLSEPWWEQTFLTGRYQCLERAHHPQTARALEELTEYLEEGRGNIAAGVLNTIKPGPPPAAASVTSAIGDTPDPP